MMHKKYLHCSYGITLNKNKLNGLFFNEAQKVIRFYRSLTFRRKNLSFNRRQFKLKMRRRERK